MGLREKFLESRLMERVVDGPVGQVLVKSMTVGTKDRIQNAAVHGYSCRPIVLRECLFDPDTRQKLFESDDEVVEIPADVAEPYIDVAYELSALRREEVEELEGNSGRTPSSDTEST